MKLGTWLLSLCQPILSRVLIALGFAVVTITGMQAVIEQVKQLVVDEIGGMPADAFSGFIIAGGGEGLALLFGAITTKVLLWQITQSVKLIGISS